MEPQRFRCALIAASMLAGATLALLPGRAPAQGFSTEMQSALGEVNQLIDLGIEERRPRFEMRRLEEARDELARAFDDRHVWNNMDADHRDHGGVPARLE